jgi:hypothetical protein
MTSSFLRQPAILILCSAIVTSSTALTREALESSTPSNPILNRDIPAVFDPAPNYDLCTDPEDGKQLSDGLFEALKPGEIASSSLWGRKGTVGWAHAREPIFITFDLGSVQPIGGMMVSSAAGTAGVFWPSAIAIVISDDGKNWSSAGELISRSRENGLPPATGYTEHQFVVNDLNITGRYVGICAYPGGNPFFFLDELAVFGSDSQKPAEVLHVIGDMAATRQYVKDNVIGYSILRRLALDCSLIQTAIKESALDSPNKDKLKAQLASAAATADGAPLDVAPGFRTVIPINETESRLLSVFGSLLKAEGYPSLLITKQHRNAYLGWLETPPTKEQESVTLNFRQMGNEVRGDMLLVTNASALPKQVTISIDTPCQGMSLFYCPWTDTPQLEPVAMALLPVPQEGDGWKLDIPAGLTMKLWVSVDSSKTPVGEQDFQLSFADQGAEKITVGMKVKISSVAMGTPSLHLGMWDYTNGAGAYQLTPENRAAAIEMMRSHNVDSPWGTPSVLPVPKAEDYDASDKLVSALDFTAFDEWVKMWPNSRRYMIFVNVSSAIGGVPMESPRFANRVAQWARAVADHASEKGLKPEQICLLLFDEPSADSHDEHLLAWAKPIKAAATGLTIWSDPVWKDPAQAAHPEAFKLPDVLCPNWGTLAAGGGSLWKFYQQLREEGKPMELYMCSAPAPHTDPNRYYRLMPWAGWKLQIQGIGFWAFSDAGGLKDAWSAYDGARGTWFTPVFLGTSDVTNTIQWEAVRDGMQDYEYLLQLEKQLPLIKNTKLKKEAEDLLSQDSIQSLFHGLKASDGFSWPAAKDSEAPDRYREKILTVLEKANTL